MFKGVLLNHFHSKYTDKLQNRIYSLEDCMLEKNYVGRGISESDSTQEDIDNLVLDILKSMID